MTQNNVGIYASQISGHLWSPEGAYDSLATVTVPSGGAASVDFVNIPQGYKHLQIRGIARIDGGSSSYNAGLALTFNSDKASNYNNHQLYGLGSGSAGAGVQTGSNPTTAIWLTSGSAQFASHIIDIIDYSNINKYTTTRVLSGTDTNGGGAVALESGAWRNTAAVNSIGLTIGTFNQYTSFALYGVK